MRHEPARTVLVTGASRGVGGSVARQLADPDTHVIVNYRKNARRAEAIASIIRDAGGHASTLAADISDEADTAAMIENIAARFGRLDAMILNASGGLELEANPGYAMLDRDAQRRLARQAISMMPVGARIVFVTSHQAHFFPNKAVPKGYAAVAASMRAGETALYAMRSVFARAGVRFTVVSGDISDGDDFAAAIVNSVTTPSSPSVVYVGGANYLMTA
jgi:NAD(P)-dependent dehydrogenase (short-subunit alcohol dehydrogenase family)